MSRSDPPRVLSLTPMSLSRDSRTLKAAMTYARLGAESCVIEDKASNTSWQGWPIKVAAVRREHGTAVRQLGRRGLRQRSGTLLGFAIFLAYLGYFVLNYCLRPLPLMRRATLYHLHSYEYFPLIRAWTALVGGRYLYDIHDFYSELDKEAELLPTQRRWIKPFQQWIERRCVKGAASVVTVNDGIAHLIERTYGRRPEIVRNCHDFRLDRQPRQGLRERLGLGGEHFLVVSVGHNKPGRTVEEALAALALLPPRVHLAFIGNGYEMLAPRIAALGLAGRVHLPGAVPPDEVVPFIASADAALFHYYGYTATYEYALPNNFFQALAAGLPLVYAPLPEMRKSLEPYGVGIAVDPRSPAAIAAAIGRLAGDPAECQRQAEASRRAGEALSFEREEERLIEIVRRIAPLPDAVAARAALRS
jgi:glycosyltransferase involved in cell wall biosynthesis